MAGHRDFIADSASYNVEPGSFWDTRINSILGYEEVDSEISLLAGSRARVHRRVGRR